MGPESQLREDLADAMRDCAVIPVGSGRDSGERKTFLSLKFSQLFFLRFGFVSFYNFTNAH
jgi:hypothetical protein